MTPGRTGHIDWIWEIPLAGVAIAGWCTDQGTEAQLVLKQPNTSRRVALGTPRIHRADVCEALGLTPDPSIRLGFFIAVHVDGDPAIESVELGGRSLDWRSLPKAHGGPNTLVEQWLAVLNWGATPLCELDAWLQGSLGTALSWIQTSTTSLQLIEARPPDRAMLQLTLLLPNWIDLAWLQLWRLAMAHQEKSNLAITLLLDSRPSALGDPEQISAELLRGWPALGLPKPNLIIAAKEEWTRIRTKTNRYNLTVDTRRWLLPAGLWLPTAIQHPQLLQDEKQLIRQGFKPIEQIAPQKPNRLADEWTWRLCIEQWMKQR